MKLKWYKIPDILFKFILAYLLTCFVLSVIVSYKNNKATSFTRTQLVNYAQKYLSNPTLIEKGRNLDCSGYTFSVYKRFKLNIPHSSRQQFEFGIVTQNQPEIGDLVFFKTNNQVVGHVGIYLGEQKFIHSPDIGREVTIDSLTNSYYSEIYRGAVDIFPTKNYNFEKQ